MQDGQINNIVNPASLEQLDQLKAKLEECTKAAELLTEATTTAINKLLELHKASQV